MCALKALHVTCLPLQVLPGYRAGRARNEGVAALWMAARMRNT
jgi:hypothetical protein